MMMLNILIELLLFAILILAIWGFIYLLTVLRQEWTETVLSKNGWIKIGIRILTLVIVFVYICALSWVLIFGGII